MDAQIQRLRDRWQYLIGQFLIYGTTRNWSPRTLEAYGADLKEWVQHLTATSDGLPAMLRAAADQFLTALRERGNKAKSVARRINTLRSFGKFLYKSGALDATPFDYLESPKIPHRVPAFAMAEEARRILEACQDLRDRVIITLFFRTGLRVSELANLRATNWREKTLRVIGKGNKEEIIELADDTDRLLYEWAASEGYRGTPSGWLFPGIRGDTHLSVSAIRALVYRVTARAGRRLHPHALRHSTATIHVEAGTDIRIVQAIMRHASLSTTGMYAHIVSRQKRKAAEDFPV